MDTREWPLLIFTIFGQIASGSLLVLMIVRTYITRKSDVEQADRFTDGPLFIVVPLMGLGLLASMLHLSNPLNILNGTPNLGSSWLTREVVFAVTFFVLVSVYTFLQWRKIGGNTLRTIVGWVTVAAGLLQVFGMGLAYMIRTQPAWNTVATPISFYTTSLLMGVVTIAAVLVVNYNRLNKDAQKTETQMAMLRRVLQGLAIASIILLGVEFLVIPFYMAYLSSQGPAALESLNLMVGAFGFMLGLRLFFVFVGAGILAASLYRNASILGKESTLSTLVYSSLVLVLVSEVMGRVIFYATHVRIGL